MTRSTTNFLFYSFLLITSASLSISEYQKTATSWHDAPTLDAFSNYEDMQNYFTNRNLRALRHLDNPTDDSYLDAFNKYNEQPSDSEDVKRLKRATSEQKLPTVPTLLKFDLSDAVEPSEEVKELIKKHRSLESKQQLSLKSAQEAMNSTMISAINQNKAQNNTRSLRNLRKTTRKITEVSKSRRTKRDLPKESKDFSVTLIPFELSDAKEPDEATRRAQTKFSQTRTKRQLGKEPKNFKVKFIPFVEEDARKIEPIEFNSRNIKFTSKSRLKRSIPKQPENFKVKFIPFQVSDAREPLEEHKKLIKRMRALKNENSSYMRPSKISINDNSDGSSSVETNSKLKTQRSRQKRKRVRRSALRLSPQMFRFEISDAKEPNDSMKQLLKLNPSRTSKDMKVLPPTKSNKQQTNDLAKKLDKKIDTEGEEDTKNSAAEESDNDQNNNESKRSYVYDNAPLKVKKSASMNSLPHAVQKVITQMLKENRGGKAIVKYVPASEVDYAFVKPIYSAKLTQPAYGTKLQPVAYVKNAEQQKGTAPVQVQIHSVPVVEKVRYVYTPVYTPTLTTQETYTTSYLPQQQQQEQEHSNTVIQTVTQQVSVPDVHAVSYSPQHQAHQDEQEHSNIVLQPVAQHISVPDVHATSYLPQQQEQLEHSNNVLQPVVHQISVPVAHGNSYIPQQQHQEQLEHNNNVLQPIANQVSAPVVHGTPYIPQQQHQEQLELHNNVPQSFAQHVPVPEVHNVAQEYATPTEIHHTYTADLTNIESEASAIKQVEAPEFVPSQPDSSLNENKLTNANAPTQYAQSYSVTAAPVEQYTYDVYQKPVQPQIAAHAKPQLQLLDHYQTPTPTTLPELAPALSTPVIKIEYHAPPDITKQNYKDLQEFKELSALMGKSPEDQMHGLTYLLAKDMQAKLQRQQPQPLPVQRPQDNKAPIVFPLDQTHSSQQSVVPQSTYQPVLPGRLIGMAKTKEYIPIVENHSSAEEEAKDAQNTISHVQHTTAKPDYGLRYEPKAPIPNSYADYGLSPNYESSKSNLYGKQQFVVEHVVPHPAITHHGSAKIHHLPPVGSESLKLQSHLHNDFHADDGQGLQYASKYAFGYRIRDFHTGNDFGHKQNRDLDGVTRGQYHILLPDGRIQNVIYHADDTGFHADVSFESGH